MSLLANDLDKPLPHSPSEPDREPTDDVKGTDGELENSGDEFHVSSSRENLLRQISKISSYDSGEDDPDEDNKSKKSEELVLGPLISLKDQLEKDKEDESLRRWKEQLLGNVQIDAIEDGVEPEVKVASLSILSAGRPEIMIHFPLSDKKSHLFTLKEGTSYNFKFTFLVRRNIVSGLTIIHTVWKNGIKVDSSRVMLGSYSPQLDAYSYIMETETAPSGLLARGAYAARVKFMDDDGRCHFKLKHTFEIRKDWKDTTSTCRPFTDASQ